MSNTAKMSAGAAYGSGIYLANALSTSLMYSRGTHVVLAAATRGTRAGGGWPKSKFSPGVACVALCEVINRPEQFTYVGGFGHDTIYVVPQEEFVMTRYFLLFDQNAMAEAQQADVRACDLVLD